MMNLTIFINGINRTNYINTSSFSILDALYSTTDVLKFTTQTYVSRPYIPEVNDDIKVYNGAELIYGGIIMQVDKSVDLAQVLIDVSVSCVDYGQLLDRRLIIERLEDTSVHGIVTYLVATYAPDFTVVLPGEDTLVKSITFNSITVIKAFEKLSKLTNYQWYIEYDKSVHFFKTLEIQAPFNIIDKNGKYIPDTLNVDEDLSQLKNRITLKGGEIPVNEVTLEFLGSQGVVEDDGATTFDTVQKFSVKPEVTRNGIPVAVGTVGIDSAYTGIWEAMWSFKEKFVRFEIYVNPSDNVIMTGTPLEAIQVRVQDSVSIRKYGRWDINMDVPGIRTRAEALQYAEAQRNTFSKPTYSIKFSTYTQGLAAGQTIRVKLAQFDIDELFFIQSVTLSLISNTKGIWKVNASTTREITFNDILAEIIGMKELEELSTEGLETLLDIPTDDITLSDEITGLSTKEGPYTIWPSVGDGLYMPIVVNFSTMGPSL